ncbi:MAG: EscU/YscU/HrcU family type III secretion system export apparatus switch protein [Bdellovibrionota bacterium]
MPNKFNYYNQLQGFHMAGGGDSSQEKTEQPTRKRLEDARKEGQTVKSKELTSFFSLISLFTYFIFMYTSIVSDFTEIYNIVFKSIHENFLFSDGFQKLNIVSKSLFVFAFKILIFPVIIASVVSGFVAMVQVGGIILTPKAMEIKFDKFNIVSNAKNIFSMQSLKKFVKDMFQLTIMVLVAYYLIKQNISNILNSGNYNLSVIAGVFFKILSELFLYLLLIYLVFAIIDYVIERISFMKKMMMSIEEVRKESKDTEVSQQVKQRQREIHQEMMEEESMNMSVKNSTMVITNPTHIAIVILYDPEKIKLPAVILKAQNNTAQLVKKLAKKHGILVVRDVWLARQLFALAEVKKYVPSSLVAPVADLIGRNLHLLPKALQESFARSAVKMPPPTTARGPKKPGQL